MTWDRPTPRELDIMRRIDPGAYRACVRGEPMPKPGSRPPQPWQFYAAWACALLAVASLARLFV